MLRMKCCKEMENVRKKGIIEKNSTAKGRFIGKKLFLKEDYHVINFCPFCGEKIYYDMQMKIEGENEKEL